MNVFFKNSLIVFLVFTALDIFAAFVDNERISAYTGLLIVTASWAIIITGVIKYKLINRSSLRLFDKTLFVIFLWWCFINIVRSVTIPLEVPQSFPRFLGGNLYAAAWIVPVFLCYGTTIKVWKEIWAIAIIFTKIFVILSPLYLFFYSSNTYFFSNIIRLILFIPLLMINWHLIDYKYKKFVVAGFILGCLYSVHNSERHLLAKLFFYPVAYYSFLFFNNVTNRISNFNKLSFYIAGMGVCFFLLYSGFVSKLISDPTVKENIETFEAGNLNADSRKMVYEDFFEDFQSTEDWIFGRGVLGTTFSEQFITIQIVRGTEENVFNLPLGHRTEVEGGYLMYFLKVGLIGLCLLLLLSLRAILLAFFKSNNYFVKACAFIIIEWLISMYPYGVPDYNFGYILFWLCMAACLSTEMRSYTNQEIKEFFSNVNYIYILNKRFKI